MAARSIKRVGALDWHRADGMLGKSDTKNIGPNTWLRRLGDGIIGVLFHRTFIIHLHSDGAVLLFSGGFRTATTKERLSALSPVHVCQVKGVWWVGEQVFSEGMNVGVPRNEREALEASARHGDTASAAILADHVMEFGAAV